MQEILIEKIRTDSGVQSRAAINAEYVAELAEAVKAGKRLPPITVYRDGDEIWASDGFHRIRAHEAAGRRTIRADVHKGGQKEAAWASCAANITHGLRRTNADKRHAVELALKTDPGKSDQAIADHVGVHANSVSPVRREMERLSQIVRVETRTGKDGVTRKTPPLPPQYRKQPQQDTPCTPPPPPPENRRIPPPPPNRPAKAQAGPVDELGKPIPDHVQPLFDRAVEVNSMLADLSRIKCALQAAEKVADPLYAETNIGAAVAALQTAYDQVKATIPYAVCPWCRGVLAADCRGCGGRGAIGEFRYKTVVPRDLK